MLNKGWLSTSLASLAILTMLTGCSGGKSGGEGTTTGESSTTGTSGENKGSSDAGKRPATTADGNKIEGNEIKIGLIAAQQGDQASWGIDSVKGAQLAVDEVNAAGGVNGKKIKLIIGDSQSKPEQGKSAAEKLISDGVIGIVGEVASGTTIQIAKSAFPQGIPVVSIGSTRDDVTDVGNNVFRVCYTDSFQGPVMAKFAFEDLKLSNIAIVTDQKLPYSQGLSENFRKYLEKIGGKVVDEQFYNSGDTQFSAQITNLKSKNPDGVFLSGYYTEVGQFVKQMRDAGLKVPVFGGDGWDSSELQKYGGAAITDGNAYFCNHYNNEETRPEVQEFLKKWAAKFNNSIPATTMGALSYDATMLMIDALKRSKGDNSKALIAAIDETEGFKSVAGEITMKGHGGNPPKRALVVSVTATGQAFAKAYDYFAQ